MNDERPIEKLLRRYAKKRRDDAGAHGELHPATRRMLQGEAARRFRKRTAAGGGEATTFAQVWQLWRKQLIWALPILIMLGIGVWVLVGPNEKPGQEFDLARNMAAPVEVGGISSTALETPRPATAALPLPAASSPDQSALTFADAAPARDAGALNTVALESRGEKFGVAMKGETIRMKQGDAQTAHTLAADSQNESALKLGNDRVGANDFAQPATAGQIQGQTLMAKAAPVESPSTFYDEKKPAMGFALATPAKSDSLENFESVRKGYVAANEGRLASAPVSSPPVVPPDAAARFYRQEARGNEREKPQTYSQAFNNRAPTTSYDKMAKSAGITPVLANFQVEQTGNQVRVIDGDGSTYLGEMELPAAGQALAVTSEKREATELGVKIEPQVALRRGMAAKTSQPQATQNYFACRVAGTNRTLNQQVVFAWNFVGLTNELATAQTKAPAAGVKDWQNNLPAQPLPWLNNSAINGRAQLGSAKEIEVNAVPVSP
jgi:hypothetical protein